MSRTDKDRPEWVAAMDPTVKADVSHGRDCVLSGGSLDCGLDDFPNKHPRSEKARCWQWVDYGRHRCRASKEDLHYGYWKPERAKVRASNQKFLSEHTRPGIIEEMDDSEIVVSQHRHGPFPGGYWD